MADMIKLDMADIWASGGDKVAPDPSKIAQGWLVEAVPRQTWNWFENRQDQNIAYLLQKGITEWDAFTEYQANKSWVNRGGTIYKALLTGTNQDPATATTYWVKAFIEPSASLEALRAVAPVTDTITYFTSTSAAATTALSPFARTLLDDTTAGAMRSTLSAQVSNINLTSLSGVTAAVNILPYFNSSTSMAGATLTAFGRSLLDDVDAATARATLEVDSATDVAAALSAGLATKQMLSATLTALAGVSTANNTISYWTGLNTAATTALTPFARTLLDDVDAATARATLSVYSIADSDSNLTTGLATKQPLDATLTALAGLATGANQLAYSTGTDTFAQTSLTAFARSILDDADAVTVRGTIGADDASNLTTGTLALARLPADLVGKNAATATALQTSRTIQGVPFNGTANITLSVVDKDSGVGSATLPAGTTAQRTASPVNGQLRYNSDNNEFEGYINGSWGGIGGGTPLFTVLWWPSRTAIPAGYVASDGQLLTRTTYSAAWARVAAGDVPSVSDATWLATSTSRGAYSLGDGSTTFRVPDLNGKQAGTLAAPFLRGDGTNSTGIAGNFQASDNLSHTHTWAATAGAVRNTYPNLVGYSLNTGAAGYADVSTSAVISNSGGVESRPVNVTGVYIIKLIGGASDLTQEDASVAVAALENKLMYVSGRNRIINGDCQVSQKASISATTGVTAYGGADRWRAVNAASAGGAFSQSRSTMVHDGITKFTIRQSVTTAIANRTGGNYWNGLNQLIEGRNCYDFLGKNVTASFVFNTNVSGTYSVCLRDASSKSYVSTFVAVANTPVKVEISFIVPADAVIPNDQGAGFQIAVGALNTGTYQTSSLNGWQAGTFLSADTATNWGATNGNFIEMTDVQIELGSSATTFERLIISMQLAQCQRYYNKIDSAIYEVDYGAFANTGFARRYPLPVNMREVPTVSVSGVTSTNVATSSVTAESVSTYRSSYSNAAAGNVVYGVSSLTFDAEI